MICRKKSRKGSELSDYAYQVNKDAILLINNLLQEEKSYIECKLIEKGDLNEINLHYHEIDDDWTWKVERVKVLEYILDILKKK